MEDKKFYLAAVGSRNFTEYHLLEHVLDEVVADEVPAGFQVIIVSGGAKGADSLAERYAKRRHFEIMVFPANWEDLTYKDAIIRTTRYGTSYDAKAGMRRNKEIVNRADYVVAFWILGTPGTKNTIKLAERAGKPLKVVPIEK